MIQISDDSKQSESVSDFLKHFQVLKDDTTKLLNGASESVELTEYFQEIEQNINVLQISASRAAHYLPSYELRQAQKTVQDLGAKLKQVKATLCPRKKFAFKTRKRIASVKKMETKQTKQATSQIATNDSKLIETNEITNMSDKPLFYEEMTSAYVDQDIVFAHLSNVHVTVAHTLTALRINDVRDCKFWVGPVAGSVHIENATDCVFIVASRQIRIHSSKKCTFYLYVLSNPIIEYSTALQFSPYTLHYPRLRQQMLSSGLIKYSAAIENKINGGKAGSPDETHEPVASVNTSNLWYRVDDFNWLKSQPSPNWSILPENQQDLVTVLDDK